MTKSNKKIWNSDCKLRDYEKELCRNELESFIADKIFDSHVHIFNKNYLSGEFPECITKIPMNTVGIAEYRKYMEESVTKETSCIVEVTNMVELKVEALAEMKSQEYISKFARKTLDTIYEGYFYGKKTVV